TNKIKPLVIHQFDTPRALINVNKYDLQVYYYSNKAAWMNTEIWNDFLKI
ncbi:9353_t:CDS:1, partial [Gigaspora rosea]